MEQADLTVRRIKDGTVIDHIDVGNGLKVLEALRINGSDGNVITIALNVPSGKLKKKDMIKVEGKFLEDDDTNKLAVIAPTSTVNKIKDYKFNYFLLFKIFSSAILFLFTPFLIV